MFSIKVDAHTHTIFSRHAYSTIEENARSAASKGLEAIAITDHFGLLFPFAEKRNYEMQSQINMEALPPIIYGVRLLAGVEIDIVDFKGNLAGYELTSNRRIGKSLHDFVIAPRDVVIGSLHFFEGCYDGTEAQNTEMYVNVLNNPHIDILGHCARPRIAFDIGEVVQAAKTNHKMIEINDHTLVSRKGISDTCRRVALKCAEEGVSIVVNSDAHSSFYVGEVSCALAMLDEIHFPEALVENLTLEKMLKALEKSNQK